MSIKWAAYWLLVSIFGCGFLFISIAVEQISGLQLTLTRLMIAVPILHGIVRLTGQRIPNDPAMLRTFLILGSLNIALPFTIIGWSQQQGVDSGLSGVLVTTNPLFTFALAHFAFPDERMTAVKAVGVVIGFIGVIILSANNIEDGAINTRLLVAQLSIVLAALMFAVASIFLRYTMRQRSMNPLIVTTGTLSGGLVVTIGLVALHLLTGGSLTSPASLTARSLAAIGVVSVFHTIISFNLVNFVIRELGASRMATTIYMTPIIALTLGVLLLDERLTLTTLIGTVVILIGVGMVNFGGALLQRFYPIPSVG